MSWIPLKNEQEWKTILDLSHKNPQIVFKHSTRCSISLLAKSRIEKQFKSGDAFYLLDLLSYRSVSNSITTDLLIEHESPQVLVIKEGNCIYHASHSGIEYDEVMKQL
jgi:bacillithiol system protein YtxJ